MTDATIEIGEAYDGYHTFNELYEHRNLLFISLCLSIEDEHVGSCCWNRNGNFDGYFCLYLWIGHERKQISYHIPDKYLPLIEKDIKQQECKWDGHTSNDVLNRLKEFCK